MAWYCKIDDVEHGPCSSGELKRMALAGRLAPNDFVRQDKSSEWHRACSVQGLEFRISDDSPEVPINDPGSFRERLFRLPEYATGIGIGMLAGFGTALLIAICAMSIAKSVFGKSAMESVGGMNCFLMFICPVGAAIGGALTSHTEYRVTRSKDRCTLTQTKKLAGFRLESKSLLLSDECRILVDKPPENILRRNLTILAIISPIVFIMASRNRDRLRWLYITPSAMETPQPLQTVGGYEDLVTKKATLMSEALELPLEVR